MKRILIQDDDPVSKQQLRGYLIQQGYETMVPSHRSHARCLVASGKCQVLLCGSDSTSSDGLSFIREIRQSFPRLAILILSEKADVLDRVLGLEMGADDYICKPFHPREVLARIRSITRRVDIMGPLASSSTSDATRRPDKVINFGSWNLLTASRQLLDENGNEILLTNGEFRMLLVLVTHPQRVLTRDQLLDLTVGRKWTPFDRAVDKQIAGLRRKLGEKATGNQLVKTIRGEGYMFLAPVRAIIARSAPAWQAKSSSGSCKSLVPVRRKFTHPLPLQSAPEYSDSVTYPPFRNDLNGNQGPAVEAKRL